ncbi:MULTISPECIES: GntR family transcriptional regulator [Thermoanaerobacterium]|uniref:GntR family transcriptional regulator n=2 Tax=Thermoanaerobacterium TaxID=28895 RepID=W9E7R2_9THEO|nr:MULTISPECIES: winged helix-turn-helix domain-containing protein [Thermoanaerobacterium]AFK87528.1 transcriptional regulator, GntR family [Thermoanaerobacterium saccharolyticum JW/SL-YS485]ETO37633.1 GntR family transcriptional regulator [Thermoanaerobacterium aotearoense SCUT27]
MLRKVDKHSGVPAYLQITNMIKSEILLGNLQKGSQLSSIRELQQIFDVNINTVLKALEKLKSEGYIEAEQGVGYFVKKDFDVDKKVIEIIKTCVAKLKDNSIDYYTAILIFEEVWKNE